MIDKLEFLIALAREKYFALSSEGRKSFRDMKSYRRRKRWI